MFGRLDPGFEAVNRGQRGIRSTLYGLVDVRHLVHVRLDSLLAGLQVPGIGFER